MRDRLRAWRDLSVPTHWVLTFSLLAFGVSALLYLWTQTLWWAAFTAWFAVLSIWWFGYQSGHRDGVDTVIEQLENQDLEGDEPDAQDPAPPR